MWFYLVDEDVCADEPACVGYFHHMHKAFEEFEKSPHRRVIRYDFDYDTNRYVMTTVWEHPDEDEETQ